MSDPSGSVGFDSDNGPVPPAVPAESPASAASGVSAPAPGVVDQTSADSPATPAAAPVDLDAARAAKQQRKPDAAAGYLPARAKAVHATAPQTRAEAGRALRDRLPRKAHAAWKPAKDRRDPIEILHEADADRLPELIPIRYGRMLQSAFAFYRGTAGLMAADLATTPNTGVQVALCGDCHLMNFGGFATPERNILFDMNDFDEVSHGPWEWDVKRLATSFILACRSNGMPDSLGRDVVQACVRSYRKQLAKYAAMSPLDVWYARITSDDMVNMMPPSRRGRVLARIEKAATRAGSELDFPKLAHMVGGRLGIREAPPLIFHPTNSLQPEFEAQVQACMADYRETLSPERRLLFDRYRYVDAAIKVVGVGSVGRRCWIGLFMSAANEPLFLQFKEAVASVLEPYAGASPFAHHGERVVIGQRTMQPASDLFLGWFTGPAGRHFYVRQLRDAKIKPLVETFDAELMEIYAKGCGWVLARGHAKGGDAATISGYLGSGAHFDEAIADFAVAYADQAQRDHAALKEAVNSGRVTAFVETT